MFSDPVSFPHNRAEYIASRRINTHCSAAVCRALYVTVTCKAARWSASVSTHKYLPAPSQQAFIIVNTLYVTKEFLCFSWRCRRTALYGKLWLSSLVKRLWWCFELLFLARTVRSLSVDGSSWSERRCEGVTRMRRKRSEGSIRMRESVEIKRNGARSGRWGRGSVGELSLERKSR